MLAKLQRFENKVTLIQGSGLQFLDFGLTLDPKGHMEGQFVLSEDGNALSRLVYDERRCVLHLPGRPDRAIKPKLEIPLDDSVRLFDGTWLPLPFFRLNPPNQFANGPETWARARLVALGDRESPTDGHTHRLTIAIDTSVLDDDPDRRYLAPTASDVQSGASFGLAHGSEHMGWFPALPWVDGWLSECFDEGVTSVPGRFVEDLSLAKKGLAHHGHYLNFLAIIAGHATIPQVKLTSNVRDDLSPKLNVDLVLDIGNSRSFGILIEDHPKERDALKWRYELALRDLSESHHVYSEPFESRVELAQPVFGRENWAARSGRGGAFLWPTIARVGPEAARLAGRRRGTEGATGISSPKRYLWDEDRFLMGWRFNSAFVRSEIEPKAVAPPISTLIDETGRALFELDEDERIPVFKPHYSRSAMMTFMLAEVCAQALCQINGVAQRLSMGNADLPRHLRTIILTVPPSMPKQERDIFQRRVKEAVGIVWKAMGWHPPDDPVPDDPIEGEGAKSAWPPLPAIEVSWDEASCGQVVYLYNESNNYGGATDALFDRNARRRPGREGSRLTIASVDIGGGTTDLVINDYLYDAKEGGPASYIVPTQIFRDGFRIAGDDILLQVIQTELVPALTDALKAHGIQDPDALKALLVKMIGTERLDARESVLRQQLVVQLIYPAGLALLSCYEDYDPFGGPDVQTFSLGDLAEEGGGATLSPAVMDFVQQLVRSECGPGTPPFYPLNIEIRVDLAQIHRLFLSEQFELGRPIRSLCEVIHRYACDILLLTGRPSRLPGIQSLFRSLLPLPPDRIIPLHTYRTDTWYPFNQRGRIGDPKTTAAVGAMLCVLGQGRLPNFFFRAKDLKLYSTVRHVGVMDNNMVIPDANLIYRDLQLDTAPEDYALPELAFPVLGVTRIGFRQLDVERWAASPLYQIEVRRENLEKIYRDGTRLLVTLKRCPRKGKKEFREYLCVDRVELENGPMVDPNAVRLQLYTLTTIGLHDDNYWLDSGGIYK